MANQKHLDILRQGVEVWNRWRKENVEIKPDLCGADLCGADLMSANLSAADLSAALLSRASLSRADIRDTDLSTAYLKRADLSRANLSGANLTDTNLSGAILIRVNLSEMMLSGRNFRKEDLSGAIFIATELDDAVFKGATLTSANFTSAKLSNANLRNTTLAGAKFIGARLWNADLSNATLTCADFSSANLSDADLSDADLSGATLKYARLSMARLINANLDLANLTGANLWETQRAGWSIKEIICESAYWDKEANVKTTYIPREFERLFADNTKVRLFFKDGLSPLEIATLPALIKHLEEAHPGCGLRLTSIREDSGGAVVELVIEGYNEQSPHQVKQLQAALETAAEQLIEYQRQALFEKETRLWLEGRIEQLSTDFDKLIVRPHIIVNTQGGPMAGDTYNIQGQAGAVGPNAHAHDMTFNQIVNHIEQNINLDELAKQLGELRQAMAQRQDSPQAAIALGEVAKAEIAATEKNTSKVVEHLKAAGKWTMDFAKDVGKDLVVDVIKKATGMP